MKKEKLKVFIVIGNMNILICGIGAIGSNLAMSLVPDLKGEDTITVLDKDIIEERNLTAGTQRYTPEQVGLSKVEAFQFNIYKWFQREINIMHTELEKKLVSVADLYDYGLVIDCLDNHAAREKLQSLVSFSSKMTPLLHIGFSTDYTFTIEWADNYQVPTDDTTGFDICEMPGAAAFVSSVASLGSLVAEEYINNQKKLEITGGKFIHSLIK